MVWVIKKPVEVWAEQQESPGAVFDKLHGVSIPFKAGDWIITGIKGEKYPCDKQVFEETYTEVNKDV